MYISWMASGNSFSSRFELYRFDDQSAACRATFVKLPLYIIAYNAPLLPVSSGGIHLDLDARFHFLPEKSLLLYAVEYIYIYISFFLMTMKHRVVSRDHEQ